MELAKEGTLKKYIQKNGAQSEEIASNFAENILQGLDYLHNAGVIHKDLKTSNVLMMPKNEIQVSDYGIA
jgi:serine/threonine protein kinase